MRKATAFCPGHVTGFFEICRSRDMLSTGSRGAGLCLTLGATSEVIVTDSRMQSINVSVEGKKSSAIVMKGAIRRLLQTRRLGVSVSTFLDLPQCQGFGMSAAGSLSAALAVADILGVAKQKAFEAAHISEIVHGGGLGDVSALHKGGITIRVKPGLPPIGRVLRIDGQPEVILCVIGRKMLTKTVLANPTRRKAINARGSRKVDQLLKNLTIERLMQLSYEFATESGLASGRILEAMSAASKSGLASMSMLGNSVFAVGDTKELAQILSDFGETYVCSVDLDGPRLVR